MAIDHSQVRYRDIVSAMAGKPTNFPNTSTVAEFRPYSQTIHLHKILRDDFLAAVTSENHQRVRSQIETIMHETTHWADLIGTIWGREYLVIIYNALHAALSPESAAVSQLWRLVELHDFSRRVDYGDYYKHITLGAKGDPKVPWTIEYTSGNEFDAQGRLDLGRPIFFVRFLDRISGNRVSSHQTYFGFSVLPSWY